MAKRIQQILHYILTDFSRHSGSYNLFFYDLQTGSQYVKIVPRYVTSPLYIAILLARSATRNGLNRLKMN